MEIQDVIEEIKYIDKKRNMTKNPNDNGSNFSEKDKSYAKV